MRPTRDRNARTQRTSNGSAQHRRITVDMVRKLNEKSAIDLIRLFNECSGTNAGGLETLFGIPDAFLDIEALGALEPMFRRYKTCFNLKEERFNPWEFNIPTSELHGWIYAADSDEGIVLMSEFEIPNTGDIVDVEIIGISDDFETVTVSTATAFEWGCEFCYSYDSLRTAYFDVCYA